MRVIVVEDQALLRDGLVRLFTDKNHDVVGSLGDTNGLVELVTATEPDLVVLDLRMPPTFTDEGATAARTLKADRPQLGILLLSQHVDRSSVVDLVAKPGFGYLLKDRVLEVDEFIDAAQRVAGGGSALDPKVVSALNAAQDQGPLARLSARELDVLQLMAEGLRNLSTLLGQSVGCSVESAGSGRLIQAVPGRLGGSGCLRTNLLGVAA